MFVIQYNCQVGQNHILECDEWKLANLKILSLIV